MYSSKGGGSKEKNETKQEKGKKKKESRNLGLQRKTIELGIHEKTCNRAATASSRDTQDRTRPRLAGWGGRGKPHRGGNSSSSREGLPHDQFVLSVRITVETASSKKTEVL